MKENIASRKILAVSMSQCHLQNLNILKSQVFTVPQSYDIIVDWEILDSNLEGKFSAVRALLLAVAHGNILGLQKAQSLDRSVSSPHPSSSQ